LCCSVSRWSKSGTSGAEHECHDCSAPGWVEGDRRNGDGPTHGTQQCRQAFTSSDSRPPTADRGPGRNADDQQARSRRDQPFVSPTSSMIPNEECR
jgi:hypothetical protein